MNLYNILGLLKDATVEEIKKAYKSLSQKHHPDKEDGDNDLFVEIQMAYETLSDPVRKKHYDATGDDLGKGISPEDQSIARINMFLAGLLEQIINNDQYNESTTDVLLSMSKNITANKEANEAAVKRAEVLNAKRDRIMSRISKKGTDENVLSKLLLNAKNQGHNQIDRLRDAIKDFDAMLVNLADYVYTVDEVMAENVVARPKPTFMLNGQPLTWSTTIG